MNEAYDRLRWIAVLVLGWVVWLMAHSPVVHAGQTAPAVRRFAVVVGANDGGHERVRLRFATSDADAMAKVLRDLGGVQRGDLLELRDPTPAQLESALRSMGRLAKLAGEDGTRTQFILYYSGHSDERGLLLGEERFGYKELRERVQGVGADVRIAILDSCASGAFTRQKGGTRRPPFLAGSVATVEGHAFLTSSSADEAAQESDRVGGSYFTHFLATGLRGAADVDGDRMVTLTEAYEFAFDETLERTETSRGGAQHAAYDIQLAGSGDLVLTDLRKTTATLTLADDIGGRVYVRSAAGRLAAELYKPAGVAEVDLALEAGRYQVTVDDGTQRRRGEIDVPKRGTATIAASELKIVHGEATVRRGTPEPEPPTPPAEDPLVEVPLDIGLLPPVSINASRTKSFGKDETYVRNRATLSLLWGRAARVDGIALGFGGSFIDRELHGVQGSFVVSSVKGHAEGWQFSQGYNHAGTLRGAQTGFVNHAREVSGAQLGFVSVARNVEGVQTGLITYARSADAALGLLTITKEGNVHPEVYTSDVAAFNLGLRFPARYTYTMVNMGVHPFGDGKTWLFGFGLGGHAPLTKRFFLDIDIGGQVVLQGLKVDRRPGGLGQLRLLFGGQIFDRLAVFGGPTLSVFGQHVDADPLVVEDDLARPGYDFVAADIQKPDHRIRVWPGFSAGLRF